LGGDNLIFIRRIVVLAALIVALGQGALAADASGTGTPTDPKAINEAVDRLAPTYGLDPALVRSIILAESNYDAKAVSWKNAQGLMQLMPETSARFGVANPFDPTQNLRGGMSYLRWLYGRFSGKLPLILAAYNAGENAVAQYGGVPPFAETQDYVARVQQYFAAGGTVPPGMRTRSAPLVYRTAVNTTSRTTGPSGITVERTRFGVTIYRGSPY